MKNEELLEKAIEMKQRSEETEQQLNFVAEQIKELELFRESLAVLDNEEGKEFLANLGRGVYMKAERKENEKLFVEAGAGVVVRKTPKQTHTIISEQIRKFDEARMQIAEQPENYAEQFREMLKEIEKVKGEKD